MILFDWIGHMVSDTSEEELHKFAHKMRFKRAWFQTPGRGIQHAHYDLTTERAKQRARDLGAVEVEPEELLKRAWWRQDVRKD